MAGSWRADVQALVSARGAALRRTAYLLTLDVHEADDLVQSALVRTFAGRELPP